MIVDSENILSALKRDYAQSDSIVIPIYSDVRKHRVINHVSLIYIHIIDINTEYTILVNHADKVFNVDDLQFLNNDQYKYTYSTGIANSINIDALYYMSNLRSIDVEDLYSSAHTYFYNKYWRLDNVNNIIPVLKHVEYCDKLRDIVLDIRKNRDMQGFSDYNTKVIPAFKSIENNGLATHNGIEYTKYNLWSITGRPSNAFGGINYAALNKEDGTRERFISRFDKGKLVEFDFDAYHLRLIAKMINFKFPDTSIHLRYYMAVFRKSLKI